MSGTCHFIRGNPSKQDQRKQKLKWMAKVDNG